MNQPPPVTKLTTSQLSNFIQNKIVTPIRTIIQSPRTSNSSILITPIARVFTTPINNFNNSIAIIKNNLNNTQTVSPVTPFAKSIDPQLFNIVNLNLKS
jgi:hypothetical protein